MNESPKRWASAACENAAIETTSSGRTGPSEEYGGTVMAPRLADGRGEPSRQTDKVGLPRRAGLVEDVGEVSPHGGDRNSQRIGCLRRSVAREQALERTHFGGRKVE